jgi:hypothetical protein
LCLGHRVSSKKAAKAVKITKEMIAAELLKYDIEVSLILIPLNYCVLCT